MPRLLLLSAFWLALVGAGSHRLSAAFVGDYDDARWTFRNYGGEGSADWLEDAVLLDSGFSGSGSLAQADITIQATRSGTFHFYWVFYGGTSSGYRLSWIRNASTTSLVMRKDYAEGAEAIYAYAGDTIGFRITAPIDEFPAMAEISGFFAPGQEPSILAPPTAQIGCQGQLVVFSVAATNAVEYQWQFKGQNIPEEVFEDLVLRALPPADTGNYRVIVRNPLGSVTSQAVPLTIVYPPAFTTQPPPTATACAGQTITLSAGTTGSALRHQWLRNGSPIAGATNASLTLANLSASQAGFYSLAISNSCGRIDSSPTTVNVSTPPSITLQPTPQARYAGEPATFNVDLANPANAQYQWRLNGTNLPGAINASLALPAVTPSHAGRYSVLISSPCGATTSSDASLNITTSPPSLRIVPDTNRRVSIEVTGLVGRFYALETSSDLNTWSPIATNALVISGSPLFQDTTPDDAGARFYRIRPTD